MNSENIPNTFLKRFLQKLICLPTKPPFGFFEVLEITRTSSGYFILDYFPKKPELAVLGDSEILKH